MPAAGVMSYADWSWSPCSTVGVSTLLMCERDTGERTDAAVNDLGRPELDIGCCRLGSGGGSVLTHGVVLLRSVHKRQAIAITYAPECGRESAMIYLEGLRQAGAAKR